MVRINTSKPVYVEDADGNVTVKNYVEGACNSDDVATLPTDYANGSNMIVVDASKIVVLDEETSTWGEWGA